MSHQIAEAYKLKRMISRFMRFLYQLTANKMAGLLYFWPFIFARTYGQISDKMDVDTIYIRHRFFRSFHYCY